MLIKIFKIAYKVKLKLNLKWNRLTRVIQKKKLSVKNINKQITKVPKTWIKIRVINFLKNKNNNKALIICINNLKMNLVPTKLLQKDCQ